MKTTQSLSPSLTADTLCTRANVTLRVQFSEPLSYPTAIRSMGLLSGRYLLNSLAPPRSDESAPPLGFALRTHKAGRNGVIRQILIFVFQTLQRN